MKARVEQIHIPSPLRLYLRFLISVLMNGNKHKESTRSQELDAYLEDTQNGGHQTDRNTHEWVQSCSATKNHMAIWHVELPQGHLHLSLDCSRARKICVSGGKIKKSYKKLNKTSMMQTLFTCYHNCVANFSTHGNVVIF